MLATQLVKQIFESIVFKKKAINYTCIIVNIIPSESIGSTSLQLSSDAEMLARGFWREAILHWPVFNNGHHALLRIWLCWTEHEAPS